MAIYFVLVLVLIGYIVMGTDPAPSRDLVQPQRVAEELAVYHTAARAFCGQDHTVCPPGNISYANLSGHLPTVRRSVEAGFLGDGRIRSQATATQIVTFWTQTDKSAAQPAQVSYAAIRAQLAARFAAPYRSSVGTYDRANQRLLPLRGSGTSGVAVPSSIGATARQGTPMIVSTF